MDSPNCILVNGASHPCDISVHMGQKFEAANASMAFIVFEIILLPNGSVSAVSLSTESGI